MWTRGLGPREIFSKFNLLSLNGCSSRVLCLRSQVLYRGPTELTQQTLYHREKLSVRPRSTKSEKISNQFEWKKELLISIAAELTALRQQNFRVKLHKSPARAMQFIFRFVWYCTCGQKRARSSRESEMRRAQWKQKNTERNLRNLWLSFRFQYRCLESSLMKI